MNRTSYRVVRPCRNYLNKKVVMKRDQGRTNTSSRNPPHLQQWNLEWEEQALGFMRKWKY